MEDWKQYSIDDLKAPYPAAIAIGPFGSRMKSESYVPRGIPVLRGSNLSDTKHFKGDYVYISETMADAFASCNVFDGDLVFPHRGSIGEVGIVTGGPQARYMLSTSLMKLSPNTELVEPLFLFYYFRSPQGRHELLKNASTVGTPGIATPLTSLRSIWLRLPPLPEQRAIASILGRLDDKIELNRRMNETLEEMARAIYRAWFVDFEPVRAKTEGRIPQSADDATAALFPDAFDEVEGRIVPRGWTKGPLSSDFNITMGQSPPGETYNESGEGMPFFQGRAEFGFRYPTRRIYCTAPTRVAESGDTLVSVRAPVGDINLASERCCIGRGLAAFRHHSGSRSYTFYALREIRSELLPFEAEGTVFGSVNKADLSAISHVVPLQTVVLEFERIVSSLDQRIETNELQSRMLAELRDALLPKLLSGELRASDTVVQLEKFGEQF